MEATWYNPDWILNRNDGWYKIRSTPRINEAINYFLTAGWEARTILFFLEFGVLLVQIGLDNRVISVLSKGVDFLRIPSVSYEHIEEPLHARI